MNAMGMMLAGGAAHATLFAIAGIAAYLAIRRWGPAAGSVAAGASLVVMAMVSVAAMSPWPRWWTFDRDDRPAAAVSVARQTRAPGAPTGSKVSDRVEPSPTTPTPAEPTPSLLSLFLDELRRTGAVADSPGWTWREWLSAGFLASLAMGLIRLGLGLRGVAWLRGRSRAVEDRGLEELIQVLRAELGCTRHVALREASEIATPATIGWRRPVVLMPIDWRDWDDDERRAVLAHELAHVRRGDFAAGVLAQVAVAMQFHHPLAHWLSARLRLEQELAADAWGARLSGGRSTYLATLARMALRLDGRAPAWPARAFLPSQGTFVRRIQMLKDQRPIRYVALPRAARILTVAAMAALGLLVAGLRGPIGDAPAMAQDRVTAKPGAVAAAKSHNLAFLPAEARMVVSVRPADLLGRRDMKWLLDLLRQGPWLQGFPIPPEDVDQMMVFWVPGQAGRLQGFGPLPSGVVLRSSKPQDWKTILGKMRGPGLDEVRHEGRVYYRRRGAEPTAFASYTPDDRTIVFTEEGTLRDLISDLGAPAPRHPWDAAWKKVALGQVMIGLDTRWLRRWVALAQPVQPAGARLFPMTFAPLYEKARSYAMSLGLSDRKLSIDLAAEFGSPENGKAVEETLKATLVLGRNALSGLHREPKAVGEVAEWLVRSAESLLGSARVETADGFVRLHAGSTIDLAEGARLVVPALKRARAETRRYQSVNNLKQIGLAFHRYHFSKNRFPASENRDKGKFPYSWRVAILPYIEQQELYNQYHFDEPWDGPNNSKLIDRMPAVYAYPGPDGAPPSRSNPSYFVFTGESTIGDKTGITGITDGTSNTILAVEATREIPWTKPEDILFDPKAPPPVLGGFTPEGFNALFAGGAVHFIKKSIKPTVLKALITRNGGEVISADSY